MFSQSKKLKIIISFTIHQTDLCELMKASAKLLQRVVYIFVVANSS